MPPLPGSPIIASYMYLTKMFAQKSLSGFVIFIGIKSYFLLDCEMRSAWRMSWLCGKCCNITNYIISLLIHDEGLFDCDIELYFNCNVWLRLSSSPVGRLWMWNDEKELEEKGENNWGSWDAHFGVTVMGYVNQKAFKIMIM